MIPRVNESNDEFVDVELKYQCQQIKHVKWQDKILLNRPLKVGVVFFLVAVVSPLLIYRYIFFTSLNLPPSDGYSVGSCLIPRDVRLACGIGFVTQEECHPQCCYDLNLNMCYHRLPSRFSYIMTQPWSEYITLQPRISTVPFAFQNSIPQLRLSIDEVSPTHMSMTFYDSRNKTLIGERIFNKDYEYEVSSPEMNVVVNAIQGTIFNTGRGPLIASDNIWEIAFKLTNESMYGFGEIPIRTNTSRIIYNNKNGVSSIPLIFAKSNNSFHGLLVDMSDPTEITILPDNQIVIRSITNFGLKFHLFTGPKPKKIMEDVMTITGTNNQLEYWMLGTHFCNEVPEMDLRNFISNATSERLPYDSLCGEGPIVFNSDQCPSSNISNIDTINSDATQVRNARKRYVPYVSPYIRYYKEEVNETLPEDNSTQMFNTEDVESCKILPVFEDKMYRLPNMDLYVGEVHGNEVIYPNYEESDSLMDNLWAYTTQFDAVVLENNWPLDQKENMLNETGAYFPYFNENFEQAFNNTPQWNLTLVNATESYLHQHNRYGDNFANAFSRKFNHTPILSSSLWMNGRFGINRQGIDVSWTNLRRELLAAALGGISGSWLWSIPVCGDTENYDPESQALICVKWYMAATYFPMIKIHSKIVPRYPFAFNGTYKALVTDALTKRIGFLPYFYTTLQEGPLLRPMFYQFPTSEKLHDINTQFSVGDSLLIAPNLQPFQTHVHILLPPGTWYEFWSGLKLEGAEGDAVTLTTTDSDFITFIRGGSILVYQANPNSLTAEESRWITPFSATIALECSSYNGTRTCQASGKQFITQDMTLHFTASEKNLIITANGTDFDPICDWNTGTWAYDIEFFKIYGLDEELNNFDNHRYYRRFIDFCLLERASEIVVDFLS